MTSPHEVAARFLEAVRRDRGGEIWAMLSPSAQSYVLDVGERIGVPPEIIGRMRIQTAPESDRMRFLTDVAAGIRADLAGSDLDRLEVEVFEADSGHARIGLVQPIGDGIGPSMPPIPAAWLDMSRRAGRWVIDRIDVPR